MKAASKFSLGFLIFTTFLFPNIKAAAASISLDPRATYLRTDGDTALDAVPYLLSSLGVSPGDFIRIDRVGYYTPLNPGYSDSIRYLDAVFSGSATLLPSANLNRVQNAIDAGTDVSTPNTWLGGSSTDITQDFAIDDGSTFSSVELTIPTGATYIFFTVNDSLFGDNADPNGDFGATISIVPEPSTLTLLAAAGFPALLVNRRKR